MTSRRFWRVGLPLLALATLGLGAHAAPPPVSLQVAWRWVDRSPTPVAAAQAPGTRVVGTGGSTNAQPGVTLRSGAPAEPLVQTLTVMNGSTALLRAVERVPLPSVELFRTSQGRSGGAMSPLWVGNVTSFGVTPRWPGGAAPVELELVAESNDGGVQQRWSSTVRVPLGQWQTVACSGVPQPGTVAGVTSTAQAAPTPLRELQVRVGR